MEVVRKLTRRGGPPQSTAEAGEHGFAIRVGGCWRLNGHAERRNVIIQRWSLGRVVGLFGQLDHGVFINLRHESNHGCLGSGINWL
jgi:hypothetical protein